VWSIQNYIMTEAIEKALKDFFPDSTEAERFRFVHAATAAYRNDNKKIQRNKLIILNTAKEKFQDYLQWRSLHGIDHDRPEKDADDESVWGWAVRKALDAQSRSKKPGTQTSHSSRKTSAVPQGQSIESQNNERTLPQLVFKRTDPKTGEIVRAKNGTELIHVLPGRIDRFAANNETWALAVVLYIEACVDRNSNYKASILVDARAGRGWPNPVLIMVIPLIGQIISEIDKRHPGRCRSLIIFPLPRGLMLVWKSVKNMFSPDIKKLLVVCSGPSNLGSPLPRTKLEPYVDEETLDYLEKCRTQLFVEGKKK